MFFKKRPSALKALSVPKSCTLHSEQGGGTEGKQGVIRPRCELSTFLPERGHKITTTIINRAGSRLCWAVCVFRLNVCVTDAGIGWKKFRLVQSALFQ